MVELRKGEINMNIFISGLLNIETTVKVKKFPIDYFPIDYPFFGVNSAVSGVGYNLTRAFKTLGDDVKLCSFIGDDNEAEIILNTLKKNDIPTDGIIKTLKNTPTSVVLYDESGKRQIYCDLKDIQEQNLYFDKGIKTTVDKCDIAVLCNINFNRELIKNAKNLDTLIATDVHVLSDIDDEYNKDFMENSDILFLSDENLPFAHEEFIKRLEDRYHNRIIVIGMGAKGAMLLERDSGKIHKLEAYKNDNVVNTVGAGDALFSSFLHFYAKGESALNSLKKAQIFASIKIGYNGASKGFSTEEEIEKAINK